MPDRFSNYYRGITSGAVGAFPVTPSDSNDLAESIRAITIATGGTVSFVASDGITYSTDELPAGTYPLFARRIRATGTTASKITGWV